MKKQIAFVCMTVGGIVEILIAVLHFVWPYELIKYEEFSFLSPKYQELIILSSIAIGLCLFIFGTLSVYFALRLKKESESAWLFGISQGILWLARGGFELIYPVKLPLFCIENPTTLVFPLAILLALVFTVPLLLFRKEFI
jgi:hypothetical protein